MNSHRSAKFIQTTTILIAFILVSVQSVVEKGGDPLPQSFSWANQNGISYLSHVYNQNFPQVCASGWAIATTTALSSRIKIRRKATIPDIILSPQVLLNCDNLDNGCLGGEPLNAFRWIVKNNITDQSCQSYVAKGLTNGMKCDSQAKCRICLEGTCVGQARSKVYGIHQYGTLTGQDNMMAEIMRFGPVPCGIAVSDLLKNYTKGVLKDTSTFTKIDHFVVVYGWGVQNKVKYWNAVNSWGVGWGQSGHFKIVRGQNSLGIQTRCYWAGMTDTWTKDIRNQTLPNHSINIETSVDKIKIRLRTTPKINTQKHMVKNQMIKNHKIKNQMIKNQMPEYLVPSRSSANINSCQSSWAFAVTSMLSDRNYKANKGSKYMMFSVQALLNCGVGTCQKGGDPLNALIFIHKYGIPEQSCQGFLAKTPQKESCSNINNCAICKGSLNDFKCEQVKNYRRWKIFDYGTLSTSEKMKNELGYGPIVCGMHTTEKFKKYTGGIFNEYSAATKPNHYVQVVGFGQEDGKAYWVIRNSWGTAWGESGFAKMQMNLNNLGIQNNCYWGNTIM